MNKLRSVAFAGALAGAALPALAQDPYGAVVLGRISGGDPSWGLAWSVRGYDDAGERARDRCYERGAAACLIVGYSRASCGRAGRRCRERPRRGVGRVHRLGREDGSCGLPPRPQLSSRRLPMRRDEPPVLRSTVLVSALLVGSAPLRAEVTLVDLAALDRLRENGVPVVDIRTPEEWSRTGVIDGSHLLEFAARAIATMSKGG